jgi:hypothetical protein
MSGRCRTWASEGFMLKNLLATEGTEDTEKNRTKPEIRRKLPGLQSRLLPFSVLSVSSVA